MASRSKRKLERWQTPPAASMSPVLGQPDLYDIKIATQKLPPPDREFYSNTATVDVRRNFATFVFGQIVGGSAFVQNAVSIDIPHLTLAAIVNTFEGNFRVALEKSLTGTTQLDEYIINPNNPPQPFGCAAHLARVVVNQIAGLFDFYELIPVQGGPPQVAPVIRIKSPPSVVRFFVAQCDRILNDRDSKLGTQP